MHLQGFLGSAPSAAGKWADPRAKLAACAPVGRTGRTGRLGGLGGHLGLVFCVLVTGSWGPQRLPYSADSEAIEVAHALVQDRAAFEVSPGSLADALALIQPDTEAALIPGAPWPPWDLRGGGWSGAEPWQRWADLIRAEANSSQPDPLRRAQLALCARAQGRDQDAWAHLELVGANPELLAALMPAFLPGVVPLAGPEESEASVAGSPTTGNEVDPVNSDTVNSDTVGTTPERDTIGVVLPGGIAGGLHSGDLLRLPAPPPLDYEAALERDVLAPYWEVRNLPVDQARVSLSLMLTPDGIEVDLLHVSGPAVELRLQVPYPERRKFQSLYANWKRLEDPSLPISLHVSAEQPEGEIWGLLIPRTSRWPHRLPEGIDQRLSQGKVRLLGSPQDPFMVSAAQGLGMLLEVPIELLPEGTPPNTAETGDIREPLTIALKAGEDRGDKYLNLLSLAEAYLLRQRPLDSSPPDHTPVPGESQSNDTDHADSKERDDS